MNKIISLIAFCLALAVGQAQNVQRNLISIGMKDTTAVGFLKEDVQKITTQKVDIKDYLDNWLVSVMLKDNTERQFKVHSLDKVQFSQFEVPSSTTMSLRIMQFNIREDKQEEPEYNTFTGVRAAAIQKMVSEINPDIICLQECRKTQAAYLEKALPEYSQVLFPKDGNTSNGGQRDVVMYKKNKVRVASWDKFWFSETPNVSSLSWDAKTAKVTLWVQFYDPNDRNKRFYVYCTHFPPSAPEAMGHAVDMIISSIQEKTGGTLPAFLCGDLNLNYTNAILDPLKAYMNHAASTALVSDGVQAITYNGYRDTNLKTLDHIFYRNAIVETYHVDNYQYKYASNCKWISDHYPLYSDVRF
ncbi:MAG: endonuclease/exonuclease/phosphatase family protein [Bacteroidaceae bacterium]|nr:endonuclease/exonuclease/phosphatase family protein [Bacteroidaceae bacterium]